MPKMDTENEDRSRSVSMIALLIEDVIAARQRLNDADTQTARRDVVRASLAAMEGMTWVARRHVRSALLQLEHLTPMADLALREVSYVISDSGQLVEQTRVLPFITSIRLVVSQAKIISPEIAVDLSKDGWHNLRRSVEVRNRITHPRRTQTSPSETTTCPPSVQGYLGL
jgi:hypothetical protein